MNNGIEVLDFGPKLNNKEKIKNIKNTKSKKVLIILTSVLLFIILLVLIIYFAMLSPKRVYQKVTNEIKLTINNKISEIDKEYSKTYIEGILNINNATGSFKSLKDKNFAYVIAKDKKNQKALLAAQFEALNSKVQVAYYLERNTSYLNIPNLLPFMIKSDEKELSEKLFSEKQISLENVVENVTDTINSSINKNKLKTELIFTEKDVDGSTIMLTINISENELKEMKDSIIDNLKNDAKALEEIKNITSYDDAKINEKLDEIKNEITVKGDTIVNIFVSPFNKTLQKVQVENTEIEDDLVLLNNKDSITIVSNELNLNYDKNNKALEINENSNKTELLVSVKNNMQTANSRQNIIDIKLTPDKSKNEMINIKLTSTISNNKEIEGFSSYNAKYVTDLKESELERYNNTILALLVSVFGDLLTSISQ